jgi:hypothetical protein
MRFCKRCRELGYMCLACVVLGASAPHDALNCTLFGPDTGDSRRT